MKKYIICICDDEDSVRKELRKYILQYSFTYNVEIEIFELDSAEKLLELQPLYDILLLDIRFGKNNMGIDIAEKLRAQGNTSIIILITSFAEMSIEGYKAEPFRFILKPINQDKITTVLSECLYKLNRSVSYLKVTSDSVSELIRTDKIVCIYSKLRKRQIIFIDKKIISTWQSLNELMDGLPMGKFAFSQKGYIINLDAVETIINDKITLTNGIIAPLSMHFKDIFMKALQVYIHD